MEDKVFTVLSKEELQECIRKAVFETISEVAVSNQKQEKYLTRQETADFLNVTLPTIDSWRTQGILKPYKIGNRILFKRSEVESAIETINY